MAQDGPEVDLWADVTGTAQRAVRAALGAWRGRAPQDVHGREGFVGHPITAATGATAGRIARPLPMAALRAPSRA